MNELVQAIEKNDDETVKKLIQNGLNPNMPINSKMWTGLHYAIKCSHENVVAALLFGGADIMLCTHHKRNCLHFAAQSSISILSLILIKHQSLTAAKRSETINCQDIKGETPLHFAGKVFSKSI